jgi:nucleoside-diphosphate-sugar epimerase
MTLTLVTGAPGWLGTRLVRALLNGESPVAGQSEPDPARRVRCLVMPGVDPSPLLALGRVEVIEGDLREADHVKAFCEDAGGAAVFHCAGVVHPPLFVRDMRDVNVTGTGNLLQAAEAAGVRRVVAVSSNSPCGNNPHRDHRFDERSPYHPYMTYGRSKMQMEQLVSACQARGRVETVTIRPAWFYGPGQPERQTTFFRMIRRGRAPIVGDGENPRSLSYVDSVVQALLLCEHAPAAIGQTYWITDPQPYTMNQIVDTVERLMEEEFGMQVAHRRLRLPSLAADVAMLGDALLQAVGIYQQKLHVLSEMNKTIACRIDKARRELGYDPAVGLEEGMRRSLAWCLERGIAL